LPSSLASDSSEFDQLEFEITSRLLQLYKNNETFAKLREEAFNGASRVNRTANCPKIDPSPTNPTSVHRLRPGDVKVIAALGDSLTAGRGARNGVLGLLADYRGASWSMGGDSGYNTLPNIMRQYNPALYGASRGSWKWDAGLNVAVSGDKSRDIIEQADVLIHKLKTDPNVNFEEDWKVVTVFIGGNDLCAWCHDKTQYAATRYTLNVATALDKLHAALPRTFVNLVQVLNLEIVHKLANSGFCNAVHLFVCNCIAFPSSPAALQEVTAAKNRYQQGLKDLVASGKYDTREDFTVVLQPFYTDTYTPYTVHGDIDYSYFAADCFHYSEKGQEATAEALWNNMVEPVGGKRTRWSPDEPLECPSEEHPFLYTSKNSHGTNPKMRTGV